MECTSSPLGSTFRRKALHSSFSTKVRCFKPHELLIFHTLNMHIYSYLISLQISKIMQSHLFTCLHNTANTGNEKCYKNDKFLTGKAHPVQLIVSPFDKEVRNAACPIQSKMRTHDIPVVSQFLILTKLVFLNTHCIFLSFYQHCKLNSQRLIKIKKKKCLVTSLFLFFLCYCC